MAITRWLRLPRGEWIGVGLFAGLWAAILLVAGVRGFSLVVLLPYGIWSGYRMSSRRLDRVERMDSMSIQLRRFLDAPREVAWSDVERVIREKGRSVLVLHGAGERCLARIRLESSELEQEIRSRADRPGAESAKTPPGRELRSVEPLPIGTTFHREIRWGTIYACSVFAVLFLAALVVGWRLQGRVSAPLLLAVLLVVVVAVSLHREYRGVVIEQDHLLLVGPRRSVRVGYDEIVDIRSGREVRQTQGAASAVEQLEIELATERAIGLRRREGRHCVDRVPDGVDVLVRTLQVAHTRWKRKQGRVKQPMGSRS